MKLDSELAERLEIFLGATSDAVCQIYARLRGPESAQGQMLVGNLTGPECAYSQTLPATIAWRDCGAGESLLARVTLPEPCYWTPEMPHLYEAYLQLRAGEQTIAEARRIVGVRNLGAAGSDLIYDATRWVLRGVAALRVPATSLDEWRSADAAMLVRTPDESLCVEASRVGVLLVAELQQPDALDIERLSRWPAVGMIVLPHGATLELGGLAHNLLLAERISAANWTAPQPWAHLVIIELRDPAELTLEIVDCGLPLVIERAEAKQGNGAEPSVDAARALCDKLQGELATAPHLEGRGQFAGYLA